MPIVLLAIAVIFNGIGDIRNSSRITALETSKAQCWATTIEQDKSVWHRVKCPFKGESNV